MPEMLAVLWLMIWALTVYSTFQVVAFYVLVMADKEEWKPTNLIPLHELVAAFGWAAIIMFWFN